jgi:autotransporter-associated beta strand protein
MQKTLKLLAFKSQQKKSIAKMRGKSVFTVASALWFSAICCSIPVCCAQDCALPTNFEWASTGPLAQPQNGWLSLKDFTCVNYNGEFIVYMSRVDSSGNYGGAMMTFTNWSQMATATQYDMPVATVAPTLIYFAPKNIWVLAYEFGPYTFGYLTSTDPTQTNGWSGPYDLYNNGSALDETIICDSTNAYLFFANDNGNIYRATMSIGDFPGTFTNAISILSDSNPNNLFEAVQVYTVQETTPQYLMIVECIGATGHRYFRSFTATNLMGSWTPLAATESAPFAGTTNVFFTNGNAWTADISHGDMVRYNPDQTETISPCNMQFLYQGDVPTSGLPYNKLPWQPALLTYTTNGPVGPVTYTWNASPGLGLQDGSGSWDLTTADWWNGSANVVWNNATLPPLTRFGVTNGPAGTVTLGAAITVSNLWFNPAGSGNYTIAAGPGGGTLTFVNGSTVTVATNCFPVISATVTGTTFIYAGPGALTLSGTNTYTGTTTVTNGTLLVNGSLAAGNTVIVGVGGVLGGSGGTINGPVTIQSGGTLSPGGSLSVLTFNSPLRLNAGSTSIFEISKSPLTNNAVNVSGTLTCVGALIVTNIGSMALTSGDSFRLFNAAVYHVAFASVLLPPLPAGLAWNTNALNTAGTLSVVALPRPVISSVKISGGGLVFAGNSGSSNATFYLLASTNLAAPLPNWNRVLTNQFDTAGGFNFTNAMDNNLPCCFYLLQVP